MPLVRGLGVFSFLLCAASRSLTMFIPAGTTGLDGAGGMSIGGSFLPASPDDSFRAGVRGGSDGISRGTDFSAIGTLGDDFAPFNSNILSSLPCLGRLGERGGRVEALKAGAIIRPASKEGALKAVVLAVPFDAFETMERFDTVEAIDSMESRRIRLSDGLLGGRDGETCKDDVRGGSLGGAVGRVGFVTA